MNEQSFFRKLPFLLSILIVAVMIFATVLEKIYGNKFVYVHIYGTLWFAYLWAGLAMLGIIGIIKARIYRNMPLLFLHLSFIIILAGAGCTKMMAKQGHVITTKNVYSSIMQSDGHVESLPFGVRLDSFYISYYPGTNAPADYVSQISILEKSGKLTRAQVSMNRIHTYAGYRFYQSSYENNLNTSVLAVNHDTVGTTVTYTGYFMFMIAMLCFLFSPKNIFRQLLKHKILKKTTTTALTLIACISGYSQTLTGNGLTFEKNQSDAFGDLWILSEGRIIPMFTFAHEFTQKITQKNSFNGLDANQFFMSMLFIPDVWENIPVIEIKSDILRKDLNISGNMASFSDFFDSDDSYKLYKYLENSNNDSQKLPHVKEAEKLNDKIQLIRMLHYGTALNIYPVKIDGRLQWLYPAQEGENAVESENSDDMQFVNSSLHEYYRMLRDNNANGALSALNRIKDFQYRNAGDILPSDTSRKIEKLYIKSNLTALLFKINLTAGLLYLLTIILFAGRYRKTIDILVFTLLILSFAALTFSIFLRTYVAGRLPFSNGYETMLLIAWCSMFISIIFGKKISFLIPFGFLLSGCALLVTHIGAMNPKITPLVPVLSSPLLSVHVSVIMFSYTLFGFVALNSITSIAGLIFFRKKAAKKTVEMLERNKIYSLICLYPAVFLLGSGIFIGAIWANVSWGRYWGWDPKEVWALITFMIYSFIFHKNLKFGTYSFHIFGLLAFLSVLATYFGVNYILGGKHSYAGEMQTGKTAFVALCILAGIAVFILAGYLKYIKIKKSSFDKPSTEEIM
ncbi:MAG: cytochrome c biogenesis protein CcsA [Prevotellaceae bacterium]|nr:cytochrome c biogenesis protein CcsA [Prevotellaceae bacterium]